MRFSRNRVYLTSCRKCGGTTSKSFAKHNDGHCKACTKEQSLSDGLDASIKKHFAPLARVPSDSFGRVSVSPVMVITLFKSEGFWMAQHSGSGREEITSLFGTDTLPTPFTDAASAESVRDVIERLNPEAEIVVQ